MSVEDTSVIDYLDFPLPCLVIQRDTECLEPAVWTYSTKCCNIVDFPTCQHHKTVFDTYNGPITCRCGVVAHLDWELLKRD